MTSFIKCFLLSSLLFLSCDEDDNTNESQFCAEDPLQEIQWLKNLVENETNTDRIDSSGLEIIQYEYQNKLAFSINDCINNCSDAMTRIFDCEQNLICEFGGIAGIDTCSDFFTTAKNSIVLFSTRNSTSLNCEKSLIINESLYKTSKATAITNAEIVGNCLYLTFPLLITQDRIGDFNLIDSGQILESDPIQRKLKLVVTENFTKPIDKLVTTSFDLSTLIAWDDPDPILLNLEGYDTPLIYKRVPQCGDPNVNCVSNEQLKEAKELERQYIHIKAIANSVACTNTDDWTIIPIGSKACGGPTEFIAYHSSINVAHFLAKVETLKKTEDAFNRKWSVVSDCALVVLPSGVVCEEGKTVLVPG